MVEPMSAERLAEIRKKAAAKVIDVPDPHQMVLELMHDIDVMLAELDRVTKERDEAVRREDFYVRQKAKQRARADRAEDNLGRVTKERDLAVEISTAAVKERDASRHHAEKALYAADQAEARADRAEAEVKKWESAYTAVVEDDEADVALAALARVKALHVKGTVSIIANDRSLTDRVTCLACTGIDEGDALPPNEVYTWPCPTIRALEGATDE